MRFRPPLRVSVTRHGDKEQKLKEFIVQHVAAADDIGEAARFSQIQVVARSLESPVVRAIVGLARDLGESGISVRMILAHADHDTFGDAWFDAGHAVGFDHEVRWARHPRLIEAHEQLVLGAQTCWIGDSMRRDPTKCDAFESYVEGCGEAAGCALVSFERLWGACEPLLVRGLRTPVAQVTEVDSTPPEALPKREVGAQTIAATRH
ncbi:MAG: hypothetical protein ABWY63_04765 [Hyphomicrobiaceae bacterium]